MIIFCSIDKNYFEDEKSSELNKELNIFLGRENVRSKLEVAALPENLNFETLRKHCIDIYSSLLKLLVFKRIRLGFNFQALFLKGKECSFDPNTFDKLFEISGKKLTNLNNSSCLKTFIGDIINDGNYSVLTFLLRCIRIFPSHDFLEILKNISNNKVAEAIYSSVVPVAGRLMVYGSDSHEIEAVARLLTDVEVNSLLKENDATVRQKVELFEEIQSPEKVRLVASPAIGDVRSLYSSYPLPFSLPHSLSISVWIENILDWAINATSDRVLKNSINVFIDLISRSSMERCVKKCMSF
jgi:hypothetical protein